MRLRKRTLFVFPFFVVFLAGCFVRSENSPTQTKNSLALTEVNINTPTTDNSMLNVNLLSNDGVSLQAIFYPPKNSESSPLTLLLLHGAYKDSRSWDVFRSAALEKNYAVFTVDLRGHGNSGGEKTFDESMDNDVDVALTWLLALPEVNGKQISIAGESLGANLALRAGVRHPEINSVILLSPGMQLWELDISEAIVNYGLRPLLLVASEEDSYPFNTVQKLDERAQGNHKLQIYPGAEHGTEMLNSHPDLTILMLDWFQETNRK